MGLAEDTPILMHNGSTKNIQKIKAGNKIISKDGEKIKVKEIVKTKEKIYKIIPVKGIVHTISRIIY